MFERELMARELSTRLALGKVSVRFVVVYAYL